jgi:hypothetical protein
VTPSKKVKHPQGGDSTPTEGKVARICMRKCNHPWTKIKCSDRPGAFYKVVTQARVRLEEFSELNDIVCVKLGGKKVESNYGEGY